jgi:hypothetical protein
VQYRALQRAATAGQIPAHCHQQKCSVNPSPCCGRVTSPPAQPHLPSCVHSSSRILGPADCRNFVPCPCRFWCLCCPECCSCRGIRKMRRVPHSTVCGSIVMVTRMRLQMSLPDRLRLSTLKRTNPCWLCLYVRGGRGGCGEIGTVAGVSLSEECFGRLTTCGERVVLQTSCARKLCLVQKSGEQRL